jgi:ubiquinone/menaquinone biosynthesis C-methylase UbiE
MEDAGARSEDRWSSWVTAGAFGDDPAEREKRKSMLHAIRERVLAGASIHPGDVVLDVGSGDGLIALGALPLTGDRGRVIFSDVSPRLIDLARDRAARAEMSDRCQFLLAAAEDLAPIQDASVDVVTARSVLIYVEAKEDAFAAFHRVLRTRGRLSIFEPVNRYFQPEASGELWGYDVVAVADLAARVIETYRRAQPLTGPMFDFDERDLMLLARGAGFGEVHLELRVDVEPRKDPVGWETFLRTAPNPLAPTFEEAMRESLRPSEARRLEACLRPLVEAGRGLHRSAGAYLRAVK